MFSGLETQCRINGLLDELYDDPREEPEHRAPQRCGESYWKRERQQVRANSKTIDYGSGFARPESRLR